MAVTWIKEFVALAGHEMLPYASGILSAVLPCLAYEDDARKSMCLMKLLQQNVYSSKYYKNNDLFVISRYQRN